VARLVQVAVVAVVAVMPVPLQARRKRRMEQAADFTVVAVVGLEAA
jgi:hypothetical protein